ncbi:MAG: glycosyltransferase family 2 protein [Leeuwenhoekiella sp.]
MQPFNVSHLLPPHPNLKLCVTIPARNEEVYIFQALKALSEQMGVDNSEYEVIVLINHSSDNTLRICRDFVKSNPNFKLHILVTYSTAITNVGAARKMLMDIASERLTNDAHIIAMTDADSRVGKYWVKSMLGYTSHDIDLICGALEVNEDFPSVVSRELYIAKQRYLYLRSRLESVFLPDCYDPWPRHAFSCGPNMGIKKSAYRTIGGMPALEFLEDAALYNRVVKNGLKIKHCLHMEVETSARSNAKVARGFGDELSYWTKQGNTFVYKVEGLDKLICRLKAFSMISDAYTKKENRDFSEAAKDLQLPVSVLKRLETVNRNPRAMHAMLVRILENHSLWQKNHPNSCVFKALNELENYFDENNSENQLAFSHKTSSYPV